MKVKFCLYSFTILFGIGSSTAWGAPWKGRRGILLDGNLTFERQLYLMSIFNTFHVRLFHGKSRNRRRRGSEERFCAILQCSGQKLALAFHHACAVELRFLERELRKHTLSREQIAVPIFLASLPLADMIPYFPDSHWQLCCRSDTTHTPTAATRQGFLGALSFPTGTSPPPLTNSTKKKFTF